MPGHNNTVTAVILAGGRARRMEGKDKALQLLGNRPLLEHVISALRPQVDAVLINSNHAPENYRRFALPVIADTMPDNPGPLAGLLSAMQACDSELVLAVPCDTPLLPADLVGRMRRALEAEQADVCTVREDGQLHAAVILARHNRLQSLQHYMDSGRRKVQDWLHGERLAIVDYSAQPGHFININTLAELELLEQRMSTS